MMPLDYMSIPLVYTQSVEHPLLPSEQVRAGRMFLRWQQKDLAHASNLSLPTIKRLEARPGLVQANHVTVAAIERAFLDAGVEFTNGDGPGVRLRARP